MSTVVTEQRTYSNDYTVKGVWDQNPRHVVSSSGSSLNYVERGKNIPGWRQRKAAGLSVTTSLTGVRTLLKKRVPISYGQTGLSSWKGYSATLSGFHHLPAVPWYADVTNAWAVTAKARNDAAMQLHEQIQQARSVFNGPTLLAELGEIVSLFRKPAASIFGESMALAKSVKKFRGHYIKNVRGGWYAEAYDDYITKVSTAYIAFQFAVKPLASDIADLLIGIDMLANRLGSRTQIPIKGEGKAFEPVSEIVYGIPGATYATQRVFTTRVAEVKYHGMYRVLPNLQALSYFGFTAPDVAITAWEALPWSFLFDYFYNINEVLRAQVQCNADVSWIEEGVKQTFEVEGAQPNVLVPGADAKYWAASCSGGQYLAQKIGVTRRATSVPGVSFGFSAPPSTQKLLNVGALVQLAGAGRVPKHAGAG